MDQQFIDKLYRIPPVTPVKPYLPDEQNKRDTPPPVIKPGKKPPPADKDKPSPDKRRRIDRYV